MASNDLARLYSAKKTIENYYSVENSNKAVYEKERRECAPLKSEENARIEKLDKKISSCSSNNFFFTKGYIPLVIGLVLLAILFIGSATFLSSKITPSVSVAVDNYREYLDEHPDKAPSGYKLLSESEREEYIVNETVVVIAGNTLLLSVVIGFLALVVYIMISGDNSKHSVTLVGMAFLMVALAIIFICFLPSLSKNIWGIQVTLGPIKRFFSSLFAIFAFGSMFKYTGTFALFLILTQFIYYGTLISFFSAAETFTPSPEKLRALEDEKARVKAHYAEKYKEISDKYYKKIKINPYSAAYSNLPKYQQDYRTVTSLIWAIENGYAYDIPGARNYWDRKANDAAVQRQLSQVQATADAALRAAQTPPEVKVDVTVWN